VRVTVEFVTNAVFACGEEIQQILRNATDFGVHENERVAPLDAQPGQVKTSVHTIGGAVTFGDRLVDSFEVVSDAS
jgi:hypothetical protein